jgi:site-specific DNA recombinase
MGKTSKSPSPLKNNVAAAYLRVSTERQEESGFSLENQEKMAFEYAKQYGLELSKDMVFKEVKSASTTHKSLDGDDLETGLSNRPILLDLLHMAAQDKFQNIIIFSRDRLARDLGMFIALNLEFEKLGVKIHYSRPGEVTETTDSKIYKFLDLILASVAELESNVLSTRVKGGNRICIKNSYWAGGKPPFGYVLQKDKNYFFSKRSRHSKLKPSVYEKSIVQEIFQLYIQGYSYKDIAIRMNGEHRYIDWTKSKIETIIKNETYTGKIAWNRRSGKRNSGKKLTPEYSPYDEQMKIIDTDIYNKAAQLRERKSNLKDSKYYTSPFLLKGKLVCGNCGATLIPKNYGKDKTNVYRCPTIVDKKSELILKQSDIETLVKEQLQTLLNNNETEELCSHYQIEISKRIEQFKQVKEDLEKKTKEAEKLQDNVDKMLDDEKVAPDLKERLNFQNDILDTTKEHFLNKIHSIDKQLEEFNSITKEHYDKALTYFKNSIFTKDSHISRLLIDILIEHITVHKIEDELSLSFLINPLQGVIVAPK